VRETPRVAGSGRPASPASPASRDWSRMDLSAHGQPDIGTRQTPGDRERKPSQDSTPGRFERRELPHRETPREIRTERPSGTFERRETRSMERSAGAVEQKRIPERREKISPPVVARERTQQGGADSPLYGPHRRPQEERSPRTNPAPKVERRPLLPLPGRQSVDVLPHLPGRQGMNDARRWAPGGSSGRLMR
jgi:hypothetical protein